MRAARVSGQYDPDEAPFRRRAVALVLTVLAHVGLLLLLLSLAPSRVFVPVAAPSGPLTVTLNAAEDAQAAASKPKAKATKTTAKAAEKPATAPPPPPVPPPLSQPEPKALPGVLYLSKNDLDTADISKLPKGEKQADAAAGGGGAPGDTPVVGKGRNGEPLYAAEWVREPTDAEINGYVRRHVADDTWAVIACQTVARNRVDGCYALGDTPGSNLADEMVEAAWQFLVRPPRVGGKVLVGTWVSIRIDLRARRSG